MSTKEDHLRRIEACGIVGVIRAQSSAHLISVATAIKEGGVDVIEVTMTTPDALQVIRDTSRQFGEEVLVGVGSVLDAETARAAILAGAEYVVCPVFNPEVIAMAHRYSKPVMPGCLTPTEIINAWSAGADMVKVFPATALGPQYFKDVLGPLPHVKLVPTGGVSVANAGDFVKAGAAALGVGSALVDKQAVAEGRFDVVTGTAREFVQAVRAARPA